jgi:hypothetical protein
VCAHRPDEFDKRFGVADSRYVLQDYPIARQERRGNNGERCVLVAGRFNGPGQAPATFDDVLDGGQEGLVWARKYMTVEARILK